MKTLALRLYGKDDLRLEEFELPPIGDDEVLADVVTNSICMSSHKAAEQGADHKRVPRDVADHPIIIGHEFSGTILEVGVKYKDKFQVGTKYSIQPAIVYRGREFDAPGYSFPYTGGQATKVIIPQEVLEPDCLLPFHGEGLFKASLSEPMSCIVGAFNSQYHFKTGEYVHKMGIVENGAMAILAGAGPMGLGAIDYTLHGPRRPRLLVVTDIDQARLDRAAEIFALDEARCCGVELHYINTSGGDVVAELRAINGGRGYDDVFVFAPIAALVAQASSLLEINGCMNFFAGPTTGDFTASMNFYDIHYSGHHVVGSSGGNTDDMREALDLMAIDAINPAVLITHVGGLDSAAETILNLPSIPGGKKLIYTQKSMPLVAIDEFDERGKTNLFYSDLAAITAKTNGLWSLEAEQYVLENARDIVL